MFRVMASQSPVSVILTLLSRGRTLWARGRLPVFVNEALLKQQPHLFVTGPRPLLHCNARVEGRSSLLSVVSLSGVSVNQG